MNFLVATFCVLIAQVQAHNLVSVIAELSEAIQARSHVFFDFKQDATFEDIVKVTSLPKILIREETELEFRKSLSSKILSIVFIKDEMDDSLKKTFKKTLLRWHRTDVLFVTNSNVTMPDEWCGLFEWCWQNGFYNVLLTDVNGELLTLNPFPQVQAESTTVAEYLRHRNNWQDFKGYPIRVSVAHNPPMALAYYDNDGELILNGILIKLMQYFTARYNATLVPVKMPSFDTSDIFECFEYLFTGRVDICLDGAIMRDEYIITKPLILSSSFLMVRYAQPIENFLYFLVPFQGDVWLLIGLSICYITFVLSIIHWRQFGIWNGGQFFLDAISSITYIDISIPRMRGKSKYLILIILLVCGFILSNLYLAFLSSILTTNMYERQIETLEDLRRENITVLSTDVEKLAIDTFGMPEIIAERMIVVDLEEYRRHRNALDPKYAYVSQSDKFDFYMYQQKFLVRPRLKLLNMHLNGLLGGMPMAHNWPFEELINTYLSRVSEMRIGGYIFELTKELCIRLGFLSFFRTEYYDVTPLSIEYFEMPAILLAVGYAMALISFVVEKLLHGILLH